jgi:hypothetical protein
MMRLRLFRSVALLVALLMPLVAAKCGGGGGGY